MTQEGLWSDAPQGLGFWRLPHRVWQSAGISRLLPLGEILGREDLEQQRRALSQAVFFAGDKLTCGSPPSWSVAQDAALTSLGEIIQRSEIGPVDPYVERLLLEEAEQAEWGLSSHSGAFQASGLNSRFGIESLKKAPFFLNKVNEFVNPIRGYEDEIHGQESAEKSFLETVWNRWPRLFPWMHAQVLLSSLNFDEKDARRVDYILFIPDESIRNEGSECRVRVAIEIHGRDKSAENSGFESELELRAQEKKRSDLSALGFRVIDINRADILSCQGDWIGQLDDIDKHISQANAPDGLSFLLDGAWTAGAVDLVLWTMLGEGTWSPEQKCVTLQVPKEFENIVRRSAAAFGVLVRSIERLWSLEEGEKLLREGMNVFVGDKEPLDHDSVTVRILPTYRSYWPRDHPLEPSSGEVWRAHFPFATSPSMHPCGGSWSANSHAALIGSRPVMPEESERLNRCLKPILRRVFGKCNFRDGQLRGIRAALSGQDCLVLLPAGHGKSLIFQLASLLLPGSTIVVEPLRSLMDDQIRVLHDNGISRALSIHKDRRFDGRLADYGLIYISPERLYVAQFESALQELVLESGLDLIVIDEAHSVSECGHSFRPAYLGFKERLLGSVRACTEPRRPPSVLGLTATAVDTVVRDVCALLGIGASPISLAATFAKENLTIECLGHETAPLRGESTDSPPTMKIMLKKALGNQEDSGIKTLIFCSSKNKWTMGQRGTVRWYGVQGTASIVSALSSDSQLKVATYTGAMSAKERERAYTSFLGGESSIMVATPAFGTGVDIPDIRRVIHVGVPAGLEAWYQESGRAGRDGKPAIAYVLLDMEDDDFFTSLGKLGYQEDSFEGLRGLINNSPVKGSFCRQMQLLLGGSTARPHEVQMDSPLPANLQFLGSFPGWRFETEVYDFSVIDSLVKAWKDGRGNRPVVIRCNKEHETLLWKAICRLSLAGVIQKEYRRTFSIRRPNLFEVGVGDNVIAGSPDGLAKSVREQGIRLLSGSLRARLMEKLDHEEKSGDGVYQADLKARLKSAVQKMAFISYEAVREIRIGSLLAMREFFFLQDEQSRRSYLNTYVSTDPDQARFIQAVRGDKGEKVEWEKWLEGLTDRYDWPSLSGLLSQASSAGLGSTLPDFLYLAIGFAKDKLDVDGPSSLRLARLVHDGMLPRDTHFWCLNELFARGRASFLDLLNMLVDPSDDKRMPPSIQEWVLQLPETAGRHSIVHRYMANFINVTFE